MTYQYGKVIDTGRRGFECVDEIGFRQITGVRTRNNVGLGVDLAVLSLVLLPQLFGDALTQDCRNFEHLAGADS